jgi:hypothetical protein
LNYGTFCHSQSADFDNSLICKRVLFEAFDAYIVLFYLTIYERNIHLVRLELVGAFSVDTFRRILIECLIPWISHKVKDKKDSKASKKNDDKDQSIVMKPLTRQADLDDYEQFGEYTRKSFMLITNAIS